MLTYLFGGYARTGTWPTGEPIVMHFLTERRAVNYHNSFDGAIDPYARYLKGPIVLIKGKWFRR